MMPDMYEEIASSPAYQSFCRRAANAKQKCAVAASKSGLTSALVPPAHHVVPGFGSASATPFEMNNAVALKSFRNQSSLNHPGVHWTGKQARTREIKQARDRSVQRRFKMRGKARLGRQGEDGHLLPPPESIGGFEPTLASTLKLVCGLPVRVIANETGVKQWCWYFQFDEEETKQILDLQGLIVRVVECSPKSLSVRARDGRSASAPLAVFEACTMLEVAANISWQWDDVPEPTDFAESLAALEWNCDPGVAPDTQAAGIAMNEEGKHRVMRMKPTPAVGWQGIHDQVQRMTLSTGKSTSFPPDGSCVKGRLFEAIELCEGRICRPLLDTLPVVAEFRLGDGEVCDALECAISRMCEGELAAICCISPSLVEAGGIFNLASPHGCDSNASEERAADLDDHNKSFYRILFVFELISYQSPLEILGDSAAQIRYATNRKIVGSKLFGEGRIRLALERYRRTANILSVGLMDPPDTQGCYEEKDRAQAEELRKICWLNAAQCQLKLGGYHAARRYCDAVLSIDSFNTKALYRRAVALTNLGESEHQAIEDLSKCIASEPGNSAAQQLLRQVSRKQKAHDNANRDLFKMACKDLIGEFEDIKARLEMVHNNEDGDAAESALRALELSLPRLTSAKAAELQLGKCLFAIEAKPPGASETVAGLAAALLGDIRKLMMSKER